MTAGPIAQPLRRADWPRAYAAFALLAAGACAALGAPEKAAASAIVDAVAVALSARAGRAGSQEQGLDVVRTVTARVAAAERLEGTITAALEELSDHGGARAAVALVRRGDGGMCDAYSWADGAFVQEERLWQPERDDSASPPVLPTRVGHPRHWLTRPIVSQGQPHGVLVLVEPSDAAWLGSAATVIGVQLGALVGGDRFHQRLERGYVDTIEALIGALEAKDS